MTGPRALAGRTTRQLRVADRHEGAEGVAVLDLRATDGEELPGWTPGAHIDLDLGGGLVRQYSLCGDPADRTTWRIAVLDVVGGRGGSAAVHRDLHPGAEVTVGGPRNDFALVPAHRYVFVAGGIGITPVLPMVAAAAAAGTTWELHYGGRTRRSMAFLSTLADLTVGRSGGRRVVLYPQDEVGSIDLPRLLGRPRDDTLVYACGPAPLLDAVERCCAGWRPGSVRVERFRGTGVPSDGDGAFEVTLRRSGRTLLVPADRSLLDVCEESGVPVPSSCREGICGTCETAVVAGQVDHRDSLLSPAERAANDVMFLCVSRAAGPGLVIDR